MLWEYLREAIGMLNEVSNVGASHVTTHQLLTVKDILAQSESAAGFLGNGTEAGEQGDFSTLELICRSIYLHGVTGEHLDGNSEFNSLP